ncbi:MAG: hypothetical protein LBT51_00475 [Fusobacteriaceae bacterium]|jgi:hypothetical protein|nr:hypothetical protein [Fusobacteriaceae bacterium]
MPKRFLGVQMIREYSWGYICEHCDKSVEIKDTRSMRYGSTATKGTLSGTVFSLTKDGKKHISHKGEPNSLKH